MEGMEVRAVGHAQATPGAEAVGRGPTPSGRLAYVDVLNVLGALAVVALHVNGCFWKGPAQGASWPSAVVIETLLYWPVPVFVMISGATLLGYRRRMGTREFFRRRLLRTVVPFLCWSALGLLYAIVRQQVRGGDVSFGPGWAVESTMNASIVTTYWFFPQLFALYLSMPVLSLLVERVELARYVTVLGVVFVYALPLACKLGGVRYNTVLTPPVAGGFVTYALLGWLVANDHGPRRPWLVYALGVAGVAVHFAGTLALSTPEAGVDRTFKGYFNLPALLQAVAVFVLARCMDFSRGRVLPRLADVCRRLSPLTLGVYLMHWFVLRVVSALHMVDYRSLAWRVGGTFLVFGLCLGVTWAIRRVPVLRRIVG